MTGLGPFLTQMITPQGKTGVGAALLGQSNSSGIFGAGLSSTEGLKFFDMLLSETDSTLKTQVNTQNPETGTEEKSIFSLPELALLSLIDDQKLPADFKNLRVERVEQRVDELNKLVDHLTNGLPPGLKGKPFVGFLVQRLDHRIETLETHLGKLESGEILASEVPFPLLIAMGLNPSELTNLSSRIKEVEEKLGRELTMEDLIAGVGGIIPVPEQKDIEVIPGAESNSEVEFDNEKEAIPVAAGPLPFDTEPSDAIAAALNSIVVGGAERGGAGLEKEFSTYKQNIKQIETLQKLVSGPLDLGGDGKKMAHIIKAGFSSFMGQGSGAEGLTLPASWKAAFSEALDLSGFDIQAGLPLSSMAQAVHASTSIPQAGHAHPATQTVALTLTKAGKEGAAKTMTIQLDPPELGRVDVKLEFGPDNSVRAHLLVEKPETYLMLQRDSALLNQALQDAGLDTGGESGLDFELAEDSDAFDRDNNDGENGEAGSEQHADADDILETTMTWQVNPDTGHVHYNILA